ncbi:hypothetical protein GCM10009613_11640 [Pseudonocardia kongjuensis]|uniref:Phage capsid-like C-terminal domain-containing protein n=1 Tax=Pseudonocardia kongjuensis TaxID=102227 RepID=A0ABP4IB06_9PSEU
MTLYRNAGPGMGGGILPDEFGALVERPVAEQSLAYLTSTVVQTSRSRYHIPIVTEDAQAAWTAEGADIAQDEPSLAEIIVTPMKLAALTAVTNEMRDDSDPASLDLVGRGLARDLVKKVDAAFFGNTVTNGPSGLQSVAGVGVVNDGESSPGPVTVANSDPFAQAIAQAEQVGAVVSAWAAHPDDALALAQLKEATGSNRGLLQPDPTQSGRRLIEGVGLYVSPAVAKGTIWGIPQAFVHVVQRDGATLETDTSFYFGSDRTALRAIMRIGFGFPHPAAIQKLSVEFA